jgi:hypothetical protein
MNIIRQKEENLKVAKEINKQIVNDYHLGSSFA